MLSWTYKPHFHLLQFISAKPHRLFACWHLCWGGKLASFTFILMREMHLSGLRPFYLPQIVSFSKLSFPLHSSMQHALVSSCVFSYYCFSIVLASVFTFGKNFFLHITWDKTDFLTEWCKWWWKSVEGGEINQPSCMLLSNWFFRKYLRNAVMTNEGRICFSILGNSFSK